MPDALTFLAPYLPWLLAASIASLVLAAAILPVIVLRLPADYFVRERRTPVRLGAANPLPFTLASLIKNLVGVVFFAAGVLLLFLPGQGLLMMLIGLILTNFPGKYRLEQKLIRHRAISRTLNRLRDKAGKAVFELPDERDD